MLKIWLMAVAVVRCSGGNQTADIAGGAAITTAPAKPFNTEPIWAKIKNNNWSLVRALGTTDNATKMAVIIVTTCKPI